MSCGKLPNYGCIAAIVWIYKLAVILPHDNRNPMKKHIIKYLDIYIIVVSVIFAAFVFYYLKEKIEVSITILGAGISISIGLRQYRIENDKMFKELFVFYNDKYDTNFNNRLNLIVKEYENNAEYQLPEVEKPLIIDYLNMCAEQYLWFTKGRIDSVVWKSWERGIRFYLEKKPIKEFMMTESSQKDSYYGIFEYLNL